MEESENVIDWYRRKQTEQRARAMLRPGKWRPHYRVFYRGGTYVDPNKKARKAARAARLAANKAHAKFLRWMRDES